jgi:hypothetical protein
VPDGSTGLVAIQGSIITTTDGLGNVSAPMATHHAAGVVTFQANTATTTTPVTRGPFVVGPYSELLLGVNITAKTGTSPTIQFFIDSIGADGIAYNIYASSIVNNTAPAQVIGAIGSGFTTNVSFGSSIQFRWVIGGTATPGFTFSYSILGK